MITKGARGCGTRIIGGVYAESRPSPDGQPIEFFLIDPPQPMDVAALGVTQVGVKVIERQGQFVNGFATELRHHVVDWIGEQFYPNVADFVEEVKHMGLSRRLPKTLDFALLKPGSRIICLHSRAHIANFADFYAGTPRWTCPKGLRKHYDVHESSGPVPPDEMCAGLWWEDLDITGQPTDVPWMPVGERGVTRVMPSFTYTGWTRPTNFVPEYSVAAFLSLPLTNVAVIRDPVDGSHEEAFDKAKRAGLPVVLEDE